jgi:hypothetical protein
MTDQSQPNATRMCHLTGFTKKCCSLVGNRKCERWKVLTIEDQGKVYLKGDCIDDWMFHFGAANERGLNYLGAAHDSLRNHIVQQHTESMAVVLRRMMTAADQVNGSAHQPRLIEVEAKDKVC